jgi:GNAT superfamily N-acetyltransferase
MRYCPAERVIFDGDSVSTATVEVRAVGIRPASATEREALARCISLAFATDPVWGLALRRQDGSTSHHDPYWALFIDGAMRFGTVHVTDGLEAVSVWLPPGAGELSDDGADQLEALLRKSLAPEHVAQMHTLYARFEASRAALPDHYYLSLLATDPAHRGRGVGQSLLAADLDRWDDQGVPAYLESTNSDNDHRYARAGFRPVGGFRAVRDETWISAMWRDVGGTAGRIDQRSPSP